MWQPMASLACDGVRRISIVAIVTRTHTHTHTLHEKNSRFLVGFFPAQICLFEHAKKHFSGASFSFLQFEENRQVRKTALIATVDVRKEGGWKCMLTAELEENQSFTC